MESSAHELPRSRTWAATADWSTILSPGARFTASMGTVLTRTMLPATNDVAATMTTASAMAALCSKSSDRLKYLVDRTVGSGAKSVRSSISISPAAVDPTKRAIVHQRHIPAFLQRHDDHRV